MFSTLRARLAIAAVCSIVCVCAPFAGANDCTDSSNAEVNPREVTSHTTTVDESERGAPELSLQEARDYMIALINRDRASQGLAPVQSDDIATRVGQAHADDMASRGYLSHWDLSGKKPDQRYTEYGGSGAVAENCHIEYEYSPGANPNKNKPAVLTVVNEPKFRKADVEHIESEFFNEKPPYDGHRKNILEPDHNFVGVGIGVAADDKEQRLTCTQEFVNRYADMAPLPARVKGGEPVPVKGRFNSGMTIHSVALYWEAPAKEMSLSDLNKTYSYGPPTVSIATYFPAPFQSPVPIETKQEGEDQEFSLALTADNSWKTGTYYVMIWGRKPGRTESTLVSNRTFELN